MNMTCILSHRCLGSLVVKKKECRLKGFISLEEINLFRPNQNYQFYLYDKSWYFSTKHVIYLIIDSTNRNKLCSRNVFFSMEITGLYGRNNRVIVTLECAVASTGSGYLNILYEK